MAAHIPAARRPVTDILNRTARDVRSASLAQIHRRFARDGSSRVFSWLGSRGATMPLGGTLPAFLHLLAGFSLL